MKNGLEIDSDGDKRWYKNDILHREDGPAIIFKDGYKGWYINGIRHREDGPAVERPSGEHRWFINGEELSEEKFKEYIRDKKLKQLLK